jgi:hypothetical protein
MTTEAFKSNARELARYQIGTTIDYGNKRSMVVGIFNVPDRDSSQPYLAIIPEDGLERYLKLMKYYPVHSGSRRHGSEKYINFVQHPRDPQAAALADEILAILMHGLFTEYPPVGEPHIINARVSLMQPAARKYPIGSHPIPDYPGYVADGIFLGLNPKHSSALFMTLYNCVPNEGPSKFQTLDYTDVVEQAIKPAKKARLPKTDAGLT